jgi:hypothetical protein
MIVPVTPHEANHTAQRSELKVAFSTIPLEFEPMTRTFRGFRYLISTTQSIPQPYPTARVQQI